MAALMALVVTFAFVSVVVAIATAIEQDSYALTPFIAGLSTPCSSPFLAGGLASLKGVFLTSFAAACWP